MIPIFLKITYCLLCAVNIQAFENSFIQDFFSLKNVKHVVGFTCGNLNGNYW